MINLDGRRMIGVHAQIKSWLILRAKSTMGIFKMAAVLRVEACWTQKIETITTVQHFCRKGMAKNMENQGSSKSRSRDVKETERSQVKATPKIQEHSFLTDRTDVKQMEKGLLDLMHDFNHGKLHAFGKDCTIEKMDKVRELQERLAQLHFELDNMTEGFGEEEETRSGGNLEKLMKNLETLSSTVQSLHHESSTQ